MYFRYTGSYNYGSYSNQHPHPMQSQYPSLPHDTAISGPLHYSAYHRNSSQVICTYYLIIIVITLKIIQFVNLSAF